MNGTPLYASKRTAKSLWQQYRIYRDRLELQSWILLHTVVLPIDEIQAVKLRPSVLGGLLGFTWGMKKDFRDMWGIKIGFLRFVSPRFVEEEIRSLQCHRLFA